MKWCCSSKLPALAMSSSVLSARLSAPAVLSASREPSPSVALTRSSPNSAASSMLPRLAASPAPSSHSRSSGFSGLRAPSLTSCPAARDPSAIVLPTLPDPMTPIRIQANLLPRPVDLHDHALTADRPHVCQLERVLRRVIEEQPPAPAKDD